MTNLLTIKNLKNRNNATRRKIKIRSRTKKTLGGVSIFLTPDLTLPTSHFGARIGTYVINTEREEIFAICIIKLKSQAYELFPRRKIVCITRIDVNNQKKYIMRARYLPWSLMVSILCVGPRILELGYNTIKLVTKKLYSRLKTKKHEQRLSSISKSKGGAHHAFTKGKKQGDINYEKLLLTLIGTGVAIRIMSIFCSWAGILFMVCMFFHRVNHVSDSSYYIDVYRRFRFFSKSVDNANFERNKQLTKHALDKLLLRKWNYETGNVGNNNQFKETTKPKLFSNHFERGVSKIKEGSTVQVCLVSGNKRFWLDTKVHKVMCDNEIFVHNPEKNSEIISVPHHRIKLGNRLKSDDDDNTDLYNRAYGLGERVDILIRDDQPMLENTQPNLMEDELTKLRLKDKLPKLEDELTKSKNEAANRPSPQLTEDEVTKLLEDKLPQSEDTPPQSEDTLPQSEDTIGKKKKKYIVSNQDKIRGYPGNTEQVTLQNWFDDAVSPGNDNGIEIEKYISLNSPFRNELE